MATGFNHTTSEDVGSVRIAHAAGSLIAALDFALTTGSSPWTKTTNGTNDVTYQAPGGSQVKLRVYDNVTSTTSFIRRLTAQVGSGNVFPSTTQEVAANQGYLTVKVRNSTTNSTANEVRWKCTRTDRFALFACTVNESNFPIGTSFCVGDIPVFDGSDPGCCVLIADTNTTVNQASTSSNQGITDAFSAGVTMGSASICGYCEFAQNGITGPAPLSIATTMPVNYIYGPTSHLGKLVLAPLHVYSNANTTGTNGFGSARGKIPFIRNIVSGSGYSRLDTFNADGVNYVVLEDIDGIFWAMMTSDGEPELP